MGKPEIPTSVIIDALRASQGTVVAAARSIRIDPNTIYRRIRSSAQVRKVITEARDYRVDKAELKLADAVNNGEPWAVCFTLKCLGKARGYIERQEITGQDGGPLQIEVAIQERAKRFQQKMARLLEDQGAVIDVQANGDGHEES